MLYSGITRSQTSDNKWLSQNLIRGFWKPRSIRRDNSEPAGTQERKKRETAQRGARKRPGDITLAPGWGGCQGDGGGKRKTKGRAAVYQNHNLTQNGSHKPDHPCKTKKPRKHKTQVFRFKKRVLQNTRGRFLTSEQNRSSSCTVH